MPQIICENLSYGYEGEALVSGLNFSVQAGDYLCIVGENGSGKSTLMRTILGLQSPMEGTIRFSDNVSQKEIGYLPQQTVVQRDFPASVREIVLSGCQGRLGHRFFYSAEEKKLAKTMMERLEILPLARRCYRELSGGQQQRVLLARALCATQKILLLDEPVAGLDPKVTAEMYQLIASLHAEGVTVLMISHDIQSAMEYATHILHIGKETFFGTCTEYRESKVGKHYLLWEGGN